MNNFDLIAISFTLDRLDMFQNLSSKVIDKSGRNINDLRIKVSTFQNRHGGRIGF